MTKRVALEGCTRNAEPEEAEKVVRRKGRLEAALHSSG
jgi:hypothetical protein